MAADARGGRLRIEGGAPRAAGARPVAFLLAGYTLITALIFHNFWAVPADQAQNQTIHIMKNIAMAGGLLHVMALGTGAFAVGARAHQ